MQYIIFGAGATGRKALVFLGYWRVACFAANSPCEPIDNKKVVSYLEMLDMVEHGDYIIVVASEKFNEEMSAQLDEDGVQKYFVFHESDAGNTWMFYPCYRLYRQTIFVPYVKALSINGISKYKRIAIYGDNVFLPYLIAEIAFQSSFKSIVGVIPTSGIQGVLSLGLSLISLDDAWDDIDCLVINERRNKIRNLNAIEQRKRNFDFVDIYNIEPHVAEFHHPELMRYKDIHKDERCFLIGNGPSMRIEDLDTLHEHGEICFGFNKIYRIYDQTKWRPNYYCIADPLMIEQCQYESKMFSGEVFFADGYHREVEAKFSKGQYVHLIAEEYVPNFPRRSEDLTKGGYIAFTVIYDLGINLAIYMGFKEIYLMGVDCSWSGHLTNQDNHFIKDYFYEDEKAAWKVYKPQTNHSVLEEQMRIGFQEAEWYSRQNGIRIFNATRGGKVDAFERVDFDKLFNQ